ncbi:hypothetical protein AB0C59_22530 [Streptomyces sp. NPDC048664]|uniref:hypothetical protein n=1 Tax=Streptomyces sp. NPDC048664 TaxID=3154505 RepID=UPI003415941B
MSVTWRQAADEWRARLDADVLGRGTHLGVPAPGADECAPGSLATYWSVPMESPGELCAPLTVARLVAAGRHAVAGVGEDALYEEWTTK